MCYYPNDFQKSMFPHWVFTYEYVRLMSWWFFYDCYIWTIIKRLHINRFFWGNILNPMFLLVAVLAHVGRRLWESVAPTQQKFPFNLPSNSGYIFVKLATREGARWNASKRLSKQLFVFCPGSRRYSKKKKKRTFVGMSCVILWREMMA